MALSKPPDTDRKRPPSRAIDQTLSTLVDCIVQAIDLSRDYEVDRLRHALEPFGAIALFDAELRLNGTSTVGEWCICDGWEVF